MRIPTILLLACTPATAFAQEAQSGTGPGWEVSSGVEYESGDYGTGTDIEIVSVPNRLGMSIGRVRLIAAIPFYRIEGPADVIPGNVLGLPFLPQPQPDADSVTRKGWGDLELGAAYALPVETVNLSLSGSVKLPTAENGLGTGETDYTIGAELSKALSDKIIPFASVSYTLPGSPDGPLCRHRGRGDMAGRQGAALRILPLCRKPRRRRHKRPEGSNRAECMGRQRPVAGCLRIGRPVEGRTRPVGRIADRARTGLMSIWRRDLRRYECPIQTINPIA